MEAISLTAEVPLNLAAVESFPLNEGKTWSISSNMAFANSLSYALENSLKLWQVKFMHDCVD